MVKLGDLVKEAVTGLTGVVVSTTESLSGCRQVCIVPRELKDGKPIEGQWYDDSRCEVLEMGAIPVSPRFAEANGGPATEPRPSAN